uniref:sensor histidine kinase n=2 Tax=Eisenbergiella TaxID=1432051 RepID=UPI003AB686AC
MNKIGVSSNIWKPLYNSSLPGCCYIVRRYFKRTTNRELAERPLPEGIDYTMKKEEISQTAAGKNSLSRMIFRMTAVLMGIVVAGIIVSAFLSGYIRKQAEESIRSTTEFYAAQMDASFRDINDYLGELVFQDKDVAMTRYTSDKLLFIQAVQKINEKLEFYRTKLGGDFQFFIYYPELDYFASSERGEMEIKEFAALKENMAQYIRTDYEAGGLNARKKWWLAGIDGKQYALNYIFFDEWYACCFIDAQKLADSANVIHLGKDSFVTLVTEDGRPSGRLDRLKESGFYNPDTGKSRLDENVFGMKYTMIHQPLDYAGFGISVVVQNNRSMVNVVIFQLIIILFILAGICIAALLLYRVKKRMIEPMKYFSDNLTKIREDSQDVYFDNVDIAELAEANELFQSICGQMKELKIQMYEQQLAQQKLQLDYMHLQIQPHFYINCMSLIYNMAAMGEDDTIQQLSACVSDYFRYIFRSDSNMVCLTEEMKHVGNYLEICRIRYKDRLTFHLEKGEGLEDIKIPPLLLHTFVENSVKYAAGSGKNIQILAAAARKKQQGEEFVEIKIEDNGIGFSDNVLESLRKDKDIVTEKGTRIGIRNCIQRLSRIYGSSARVLFENREEGGVRVLITIVLKGEENSNEYTSGR